MVNIIPGIIMLLVSLHLKDCGIFIDSRPIIFGKKFFPNAIENLCSNKIHQDKFRTRYKFLKKFNICGNSADGVIDVEEDCSIVFTFLFDLIEFFDCSILESKIVKKCESFLGVKFISNHPSSASLDSYDWGHVMFFYDAKQGDLSLEIKFYQRI